MDCGQLSLTLVSSHSIQNLFEETRRADNEAARQQRSRIEATVSRTEEQVVSARDLRSPLPFPPFPLHLLLLALSANASSFAPYTEHHCRGAEDRLRGGEGAARRDRGEGGACTRPALSFLCLSSPLPRISFSLTMIPALNPPLSSPSRATDLGGRAHQAQH